MLLNVVGVNDDINQIYIFQLLFNSRNYVRFDHGHCLILQTFVIIVSSTIPFEAAHPFDCIGDLLS